MLDCLGSRDAVHVVMAWLADENKINFENKLEKS